MSFDDLYKSYHKAVFVWFLKRGFSRDEAADLAQQTFMRVYRLMKQGKYSGEGGWSYLEKAARSVAFNEIRRIHTIGRSGEEVSMEDLPYLPGELAKDPWTGREPPSPETDLVEQEAASIRRRRIRDAIAELPQIYRDSFLLRFRGCSYRQIQTILKISPDAVKSRLHEARSRLRASLSEEAEPLDSLTASEEENHDQEK